ncbi:hypothetical protein Tco_1171522, partial [Tanacetum coccineum]
SKGLASGAAGAGEAALSPLMRVFVGEHHLKYLRQQVLKPSEEDGVAFQAPKQ